MLKNYKPLLVGAFYIVFSVTSLSSNADNLYNLADDVKDSINSQLKVLVDKKNLERVLKSDKIMMKTKMGMAASRLSHMGDVAVKHFLAQWSRTGATENHNGRSHVSHCTTCYPIASGLLSNTPLYGYIPEKRYGPDAKKEETISTKTDGLNVSQIGGVHSTIATACSTPTMSCPLEAPQYKGTWCQCANPGHGVVTGRSQ